MRGAASGSRAITPDSRSRAHDSRDAGPEPPRPAGGRRQLAAAVPDSGGCDLRDLLLPADPAAAETAAAARAGASEHQARRRDRDRRRARGRDRAHQGGRRRRGATQDDGGSCDGPLGRVAGHRRSWADRQGRRTDGHEHGGVEPRVSLLDVRVLGDPILRQETTPVAAVTDAVRRLVDDMFETMYAAKGIGLAAPQVGRLERVAVIDVGEREPFAIINPEIVLAEGSVKGEEGCLSIPEVYGDVERASRVVVRAMGRDGVTFDVEATDHLHGKLFIGYLGAFKRRAALAKWAKEREKYPGNVRKLTAAQIASHH